ncbi:MAG: glutathione S-transferase family protein [Caulobacterales bacterium]
MKPKLYYAPGVCSLASHIAFEEAGVEVDYVRLDLAKGDVRRPEYLKLNPKGRVPLVVTDQGTLTESPAILAWIAQTWPEAKLAPLDDPWALAQVNSFNAYLSGTLHGLAFAGVFQPGRFADGEAAQSAVKSKALQSLKDAFDLIENKLGDDRWVHGAYTTSDPYLAVLASWLSHLGQSLEQFPKLAAHSKRVRARPAAQRAFAAEGLRS